MIRHGKRAIHLHARPSRCIRAAASFPSGPSQPSPNADVGWSAAALALAAVTVTSATNFVHGSDVTLAESMPSVDGDDDGEEETTKIINWSGTHSVDVSPGDYHEPETIRELEVLVSRAYETGKSIRPVGSALSPNGLSFNSNGMVGLSNLDKIIEINKDTMTVKVEAGARVSQVLDALRPHGLTLPNLASIAEQQIGGFVSVGAHGTGASIPPCDEFVTELTIVTPSPAGTVRMTEQSHGELFRLARLGLGGLGILSEVTLKVIPAHRLVEQTLVLTRSEAREQLPTMLRRHKHIRYMWIPYEDAVVVVTNDPENELPLAGPGTETLDANGRRKKVVTDDDLKSKFTSSEQLAPLRVLLKKLSPSVDDETLSGMGFGDLRDVLLASGNMLDPDHIKKVNRAEKEFWFRAQGLDIAPSEQKLQFDCGGQQWVYEVCFPTGTYGLPGSKSIDFMEELLREVESSGIAAPSPIEQRWTRSSRSPLSPASPSLESDNGYESENALFSWVGVIMYLPSEDMDPTGFRREFITESFKDQYCTLVRRVGKKYGIMCHWAKIEVSDDPKDANGGVAEDVRARFGPRVVAAYNDARKAYDPRGVLSCDKLDQIFGSSR